MSFYYDREGEPIELFEWAAMFEEEDRYVARDNVGMVTVSTVFVGLDLGAGMGVRPLIYETMIFGGPLNEWCWRWPSEAAARIGHQQTLDLVWAELQVQA